MNLPDLSIKRPVTITMFYVGILILGVISWTRIPQELFPAITYPQITVVTIYENAAPKEVETLITKVLEESVATVSQLKRVSSVSKEGISTIFLEFNWGANMDFAALRVREKIDLIKARLPLGADDPVVMKYNPFELPVIIISLTGDLFPLELRELAKKNIKDELEKREGIAKASISGGRKREIVVELDQDKLAAANIPLLKVVNSIKNTNFTFPAGTVKEKFYGYLVRTMGEYEMVNQINNTVVRSVDINEPKSRYEMLLYQTKEEEPEQRLITVKDIGRVTDTLKEQASISRYNGRSNISIAIQKQAGANTLKVAQEVQNGLEKVKDRLPANVNLEVIYDQSKFIKNSINGVRDAAIGGGILAFFVLLFFLRSLKSSVIVTCAIPVSIMVAFSLMYFRDITVNMMSLGGLALGVGMLVDNAIVVIENIYRHQQSGKSIKKSVSVGSNEVAGAVISSTLTTIAVFLPLIYVVGIAGQLFKELAFTVTFALIASLLVALTLIPRLAIIGQGNFKNRENKDKGIKGTLGVISTIYTNVLKFFLNNKILGLTLVLGMFIVSIVVLFGVDQELLPKVDQGEFIINLKMPTGIKLSVTSSVVKEVERILLEFPGIKGVSVSIGSEKDEETGATVETLGSHEARVVVKLEDKKKMKQEYLTSREIIKRLQNQLNKKDLAGAKVEYILQESVFKSAFKQGKPINVLIRGEDLDKLATLAEEVKRKIKNMEGISDVEDTIIEPQPEIKAEAKRDKAALYNLSVNDIALAAQVALKGNIASTFKEKGKEIDIRVRLREDDRNDLSKIGTILFHSPLDITIPFKEVAYLVKGTGPNEIERRGQERVVSVSANIFGRAFSDVAKSVEIIINKIDKPEGYLIELSGEQEEKQHSFKSLQFALLLAITLVYMIMAAQFESLWQPFVIMFTVPLSIIGVACALVLTNTTLSVVALLGVIMLGGIVVNNGIVLIDNINSLRKEGIEVRQAVIQGGQNRIRPILMTALTTVLGLLPLALGIGEGAELRSPMAITVIGGLVSATFLTLVVIPVGYLAVSNLLLKFGIAGVGPVPIIKEGIKKEVEKIKPKKEKVVEKKKLPPELLKGLSLRQKKAIDYLTTNHKITRKDYAEMVDVSISTAARDLKGLIDRNILIAKGPAGPGRWYELKQSQINTNIHTTGHE